jgi:hypothetical protein
MWLKRIPRGFALPCSIQSGGTPNSLRYSAEREHGDTEHDCAVDDES